MPARAVRAIAATRERIPGLVSAAESRAGGRGRLLAAAGLLTAALAVALAVAASGSGSEKSGAEGALTPTVPLERRDLAERVSVEGALGFADEAAVVNRLAGTVTWLPEPGETVRRGQHLYELDDEPVVLLYGRTPAYRDLSEGDSGADVRALEQNLAELGFGDGVTVDGDFSSATAAAVSDWQDSLGLDQTGAVELGRVAFQPGPRRVSEIDVELGGDAGSGSGTSGASADVSAGLGAGATVTAMGAGGTTAMVLASAHVAQDEPEDDADTTVPDDGSEDGDDEDGDSDGGKDQGKRDPGSGAARKRGGSGSGAAGAAAAAQPSGDPASGSDATAEAGSSAVSVQVMTTTSTERLVTVELDPDEAANAEVGAGARVRLPGGEEVKGRIASVSTVAESASESSEEDSASATDSATIEVEIELAGGAAASGLDQAPVEVELTEEVRRNVFAVPVEALIGAAGGGYAVVVAEGSERSRLAVEPGLFADGYVEIEGEGLGEGLAVEVPES